MHALIGFIVEGENREAAEEAAEETFEEHLSDTYDWYQFIGEDETRFDDWILGQTGEVFKLARLESNEGQAMFYALWESMKQSWMDDFERLQKIIEGRDPEEVFEAEDKQTTLARTLMRRAGDGIGDPYNLYTHEGEPINRPRDRERVFDYADDETWLVLADAHY